MAIEAAYSLAELTHESVGRFMEEESPDQDSWTLAQVRQSLHCGHLGFTLQSPEGVAGYCIVRQLPGVMEILNLVVLPSFRSMGYGKIFLELLCRLGMARKLDRIWLEVSCSNLPAVSLYRASGFTEVGRRRGYYSGRPGAGPENDAIMMEKAL